VDERNSIYLGLVTANRVSIVSFLQWVASQPADTPPVDLATAVEKFLAQSPDAMLADEPEAQRDNAMVDAFAAHMKMRLAEKRATGKGGWHLPDSLEANIKGYVAHAAGGNLVDAANYLAMLKIGHGITSTPTLKVDLLEGTVSATTALSWPRAWTSWIKATGLTWRSRCERASARWRTILLRGPWAAGMTRSRTGRW
jgi:hypothetical protein